MNTLQDALSWALKRIETSLDTGDNFDRATAILAAAKGSTSETRHIAVEGPVNPGETHPRYRLRKPGETLEHYRIAMGWDKLPADQQAGLPPLPDPDAIGMDFERGWDGVRAYGYTEAHMVQYAQAAIARFLELSGQYLTNDATRQAVIVAAKRDAYNEAAKLVVEVTATKDKPIAQAGQAIGMCVQALGMGKPS